VKKQSFVQTFSSWSNAVAKKSGIDWTDQLSILSELEELITTDLSLEEITAAIYLNVNQLMDAFQFAVGIYDEQENMMTYRGMIEDGKRIPDFSVDIMASNRLASWCIRHEKEIFINDMDREYANYLEHKPVPIAGCDPKAAIYVPLKLNHKVAGLITVRTIHANVYQQHHLYILKTVGSFVVRTIALSKISSTAFVQTPGGQKEWRWCSADLLTPKASGALALLTEREKEVLFLLVTGLQNKGIADRLFVSSGTIKTHTLNIYQKMNVANRTSAIVKALALGWIS
jgi:DNA-binding CsgD family transcriptional regulator